jgi:hypothetical protein
MLPKKNHGVALIPDYEQTAPPATVGASKVGKF